MPEIDIKPIELQQFVSCTPTSLNDMYNQLVAPINQGKTAVIRIYTGRCKGGFHLITLSTTNIKKSGIFTKKITIKGTAWPLNPDNPFECTVVIKQDFQAFVDDGLPHPQSIPFQVIAVTNVNVNA